MTSAYSEKLPSYSGAFFPKRCSSANDSTAAVVPDPQLVTSLELLRSTPALSNTRSSSCLDLNVPSALSTALKGTLRLWGILPLFSPGRGSGSWPRNLPAGLASTTSRSPRSISRTDTTWSVRSGARSRSHDPGLLGWAGHCEPDSSSPPARSHAGSPPSSSRTLRAPRTRKCQNARGALNCPRVSYTTISSSGDTPSSSICSANHSALGSMCGSGLSWSESRSRLNRSAVGMCFSLNSSSASRGVLGMNQVASKILALPILGCSCWGEISLEEEDWWRTVDTARRTVSARPPNDTTAARFICCVPLRPFPLAHSLTGAMSLDHEWGSILAVSFASVSISCTLLAMLSTLCFSHRASFVFSQPSFLIIMLLGLLLVQFSLVFLARSLHSPTSEDCQAFLWLFWVGSSMSLSAQCSRLYRALLIFREKTLRRPKQNTPKFIFWMLVLCMVPVSLLLVRMVVDPVDPHNGNCLALEVSNKPNSVVLGVLVRISIWTLLAVSAWFASILEKLGATVDDAKAQTRYFVFVFFVELVLTLFQSCASRFPPLVTVLTITLSISFSSLLMLYTVFALKIQRLGLNGKEMFAALRLEKETREINRFKRADYVKLTCSALGAHGLYRWWSPKPNARPTPAPAPAPQQPSPPSRQRDLEDGGNGAGSVGAPSYLSVHFEAREYNTYHPSDDYPASGGGGDRGGASRTDLLRRDDDEFDDDEEVMSDTILASMIPRPASQRFRPALETTARPSLLAAAPVPLGERGSILSQPAPRTANDVILASLN